MKKMPTLLLSTLLLLLLSFTQVSFAQDTKNILPPVPAKEQVFSVSPDLRRCVYPLCGGWWLNPVNIQTLTFQNEEEALAAPLQFAPIYVARINYRALGFSKKQIQEFEQEAYAGKALVRGSLQELRRWSLQFGQQINQLVASGTWLAANSNAPLGPYLNVKSSGIVCITTPCPYYEAELINTNIFSLFDEVTFEKAGLDREQEARAWQELSKGGLFMTAIKYPFKGFAGEGTGLSATQVYFSFPE